MGLAAPLTRESYRTYLQHVKRSCPGKDGLPYAAWRAGGEIALSVLHDCGTALCEGETPPSWFNDSLSVFIPKADPDKSEVQVVCTPKETRPLSLQLCSNKIVSGATSFGRRDLEVPAGLCSWEAVP